MLQPTDRAMTVEFNGREIEVDPGSTLGALIDQRGIERRMIAVEYNGEILPRHAYDDTLLHDGDRLEVVQMVGGG